ncbi:uncharacterized protein LOC124639693 [Helicoverpa zea]|uniref:uncharacterized protein LOC124639693 n=1 Tax=Helicoverpa zea TaxID=7113 RepID=UPI001F565DAE|nr:uncharacterized protein LOC124639693 [Helicoverpa zea]
MRNFLILLSFAVILLTQQCTSLPVEETVVSVYTTHPTTSGTSPPLNVYNQIANNLAERITSPIYKFLGINSTKPETSTKSWGKIELQDDQDLTNKHEVKPLDNDISKDRDVEELSPDSINKKADKKPEKITLYSSYLPVLAKASQASYSDQIEAKNDTWNELEDPFDWDEPEPSKPKAGPLVYVLELFGSFFQLLWGGIMALFRPNSGPKTGAL